MTATYVNTFSNSFFPLGLQQHASLNILVKAVNHHVLLFLIWLFDEILILVVLVYFIKYWSTNGALRAQNFSKSTTACREIDRFQIILLTLFLGYLFGHLSLERVPKRLGQPQRCLCTESVEELRRTWWQTNLPQRCRKLNKGRQIKDTESNDASYFVCSCNAFVKRGP